MLLFLDLVAALEAAVDAMATPTYNFAHPPVDEPNPALWVYPQTFFRFPAANGQDRTGVVGKHVATTPITFRTLVPKGAGRIEAEVKKVFDDFLRLMHVQAPTLQGQGLLLRYEFVGVTWRPRLVAAAPAESEITFNLVHRQSRENPASP